MSTPAPAHWQEALATVTACKYQFGAGRALAFGAPSSKHFLITFNYEVGGEMHTGQLLAAQAMAQGHLFPIRFNPDRPSENSHGGTALLSRSGLVVLGIMGTVVLSLLWWFGLRGCS